MSRYMMIRTTSHFHYSFLLLQGLVLLLLAASCGQDDKAAARTFGKLRVATTTSVDGTGLLSALLGPFTERTGIQVSVIAVGTGQALKLGELGEVDLVLVHAPAAEQAFLDAGFGVNQRRLLHNDFVLVGPASDPAGVRGAAGALEAMSLIARAQAPFISRGDDSGTHKKELSLWAAAGIGKPAWPAYLDAGQGQRATLEMASQRRAYCLLDRATFLSARDRVELEVLLERGESVQNPYSAIVVNPARYPDSAYLEAMLLVGWLTSPEGQRIIQEFKLGGEQAFFPDAVKSNAD